MLTSDLSPRVATVLTNLVFARMYTLRLVDSIPVAEWFRVPPAGVSHVAWQVGHLAMAEYRLVLERVRGARPEEAKLISPEFVATFGRGSVPDADASKYPSPAEIRSVFERVHSRVLADLPNVDDDVLHEPPFTPHPLCKTKIECLHWCTHHEMLHAGQIGLLRRQLGYSPQW